MSSWRYSARGGAATASAAAPWQQYLQRGRSGGSGHEPGSEEGVYARALTSYGNRLGEAQALGMDDTGEAPEGVVSRALKVLDAPRAVVFNAAREVFDDEAGFDVERYLERVADREGVGDLAALQMQDDDSMLARAAKGTAAFLGDVATDPLTYFTFGGAAVGKRAAAEMVEAGTRAYARNLGDDVVETFAKRSAPDQAVDFVRRTVGDDAADQLAETALRHPQTSALSEAALRRQRGEAEFAGEAAAAFVQGGSTGLRRWLVGELGDEAGEAAFRALPRDVQGGLNLRMPFVRTSVDGGRAPLTAGVGGGGRLLDTVGLGSAAVAGTNLRNAARATALGQKVSSLVGGVDGKLYGAVVRDMVRKQDGPGAHTYTMYATVRRARQQASLDAQQLHHDTAQTLAAMDRLVAEAPDPEVAAKVRGELFQQPRRLAELRQALRNEAGEFAPDGSSPVDVLVDTMEPSQRAGVAAALQGHDYLEHMHMRLRSLGVDIGQVREYVPLVMAEDARLARQARQAVKGARGAGGGVGGYNQTKEARQFWLPELGDEGGIVGWRRMSPDEVNRAQSERVFAGEALNEGDLYEVDPLKIIERYGNAARKLATRVRFANLLDESGVFVRGGTEGAASVVSARLRDASDLLSQTDSAWRQALDEVPAPAAAAPASPASPAAEVAGWTDPTREAFDRLFDGIPAEAREQVWARVFQGDRIVVPSGPMGERVRRVLTDAKWRADGNQDGRAVFVRHPDQVKARETARQAASEAADTAGGLPPVPEGHVRLWRGESPTPRELPASVGEVAEANRGRYFTPNRQYAQTFADDVDGTVKYVDVPEDVAHQHGQANNAWAALKNLTDGTDEVILPDEWVSRARPVGSADEAADPVTSTVDAVMADRAKLDATLARIATAMPSEQLQMVDDLMDGIVDFHARALADTKTLSDGSKAWKARVREASGRLSGARKAAREAVQHGGRLNDGSASLNQDTALRQIGQRVAGQRQIENVVLPAELDTAFAADVVAETAEKFYRAARTESPELATFIDAVYRPYLNFFKTTATVGRGYGYDARNVAGGIWNNWIAGVTLDDHAMALQLLKARRAAQRGATQSEARRIASARGIDLTEAEGLVDGARVQALAEETLQAELATVKVANGVSLWDVHRGMHDNQVSMFNRLEEGLAGAVESGDIAAWTRGEGETNVFRHKELDELNRGQRALNSFIGEGTTGRWFRHKGRVAESSEQFIRGAAYIRGIREYGSADDGRMASLLAKGLHFDYDDLSDFERVWLRGFAIPFWTWTRNNVPLQARAMLKNPGLFNRMGLANDALEAVFGSDDEDAVVPEWMQLRLGWASRLEMGGQPLAIGVETSAIDLNRWARVGRPGEVAEGFARELTNSMSPVLQVPIETAFGFEAFTGAAHDDVRGVEAPSWYRMLQLDHLPGMGWEGQDGSRRAPQGLVSAAENTLPPLGLLERHLGGALGAAGLPGGSERSGERLGTTLLSNWTAAPVSTLTPRQQAGELRSRVQRLNRRMARSGVSAEDRARVSDLLGRGYPPEIAERLVFGDG